MNETNPNLPDKKDAILSVINKIMEVSKDQGFDVTLKVNSLFTNLDLLIQRENEDSNMDIMLNFLSSLELDYKIKVVKIFEKQLLVSLKIRP